MCGKIACLAIKPECGSCPSCHWHPPHLLPTASIGLAFLTHPSLHLLFILEPHMTFLIPHVHSHSCDLSSPFLLHQANSLAIKQCILEYKPPALNTSLTVAKGQVWAPSIPAISSPSVKHHKCYQLPLPTRGAQSRITPQT